MKIAVPLFGDRISPYFGASSEILLIETRGPTVAKRSTLHFGGGGPEQMARFVSSFEVDTILCGGIQSSQKEWLKDNGIRVVDNLKGPAEKRVAEMIAQEAKQLNQRR